MHIEAYQYISSRLEGVPLAGKRVLEVGSYDVNGSPRPLFPSSTEYVGIDIRPGPGVDVVADLLDWQPQNGFDIVICAETLEHAHRPFQLVDGCILTLNDGGLLIVTCATDPRRPHNVDGGSKMRGQVYQNIDPNTLRLHLESWGMKILSFEVNRDRGDLYATAQYKAFDEEE